ncbi:MAG: 50S ribosomal protein L37 [Nitrososphaerales archaeon]
MVRGKEKLLKGLGIKYGRTLRMRYSRIYFLLKSKRRCPSCGALKMRRKVSGIWCCLKCGHEVAGGAYDF